MLLFGEKMSVQQAMSVGLVNHIYHDKHFRRDANEFLRVASKLPHQVRSLSCHASNAATNRVARCAPPR